MATTLSLNLLLVGALLLGWGHLPGRITAPAAPRPAAFHLGAPASCAESGSVDEVAVPTTYLADGEIRALVYLPPCYDPQARPGYPLLVLIHGQGYTPQQWLDLDLPGRADALIQRGEAPPFVVLMPYDPPPAMRPPHTGFDEAFLNDLLPWFTQRYPVRAQREYWAVGGISRGAAWAIHFGLQGWDRFGALGGHSPPVFWSDSPHLRAWLTSIPEAAWPRIYLDIGDADRQDILGAARDFESLLTEMGIPHEWHLNVGRHEQAYWDAHLEDYLRWYAAAWSPAAPEASPTQEDSR